ncbi:MAG TPA: cupin domain-containing protein [Noviherbaspirillum sp.]|jgi:mannose-6-phosphate isomerase-like protein (cupin superfamily)|uniref:cupin domain-containing protein n=1 Tax=Noviherbaspirillum sp. TaxID=1926288 RepID=UPI002DDD0CA9|nr:cupin domain-containing protein [Noviherbaspirillum sp.]HEV2610658.1 cupin domain-containing protein [Noviherbaspirillum sp.]
MSEQQLETIKEKNFSSAQVGDFSGLGNYQFYHPLGKGRGWPGKLFLRDPLDLTGMEVSLNKLPAGQGVPFYHQHREHEELYVFLKGSGQFQVDGKVIDVREGSVIRVAPDGVRTWRNTGDADLVYIVIQANANSIGARGIEDGITLPEKVQWPV